MDPKLGVMASGAGKAKASGRSTGAVDTPVAKPTQAKAAPEVTNVDSAPERTPTPVGASEPGPAGVAKAPGKARFPYQDIRRGDYTGAPSSSAQCRRRYIWKTKNVCCFKESHANQKNKSSEQTERRD